MPRPWGAKRPAALAAAASAVSGAAVNFTKGKRRPGSPGASKKKSRRQAAFRDLGGTVAVKRHAAGKEASRLWRDEFSGLTDWARLALLAGGLMAVFYLAFSSGGYFLIRRSYADLFILYLVLLGLLFNLRVPGRPDRAGWLMISSLAAFGLWNLLSMTWSYVPAASLNEFNRAIMYLSAMVLFYMFMARERWLEWLGSLYVAIAVGVGVWSLLGKALPSVLVYEDYFQHNRLTYPLTYWNALAIFMIMAVPLALRVAADANARLSSRALALGAQFILIAVIFFTFSRAGLLVLLLAVGICVATSTHRLRILFQAGLAFLWTGILLALCYLFLPAMLESNPALEPRVEQGRLLGIMLLVLVAIAAASQLPVSRAERKVVVSRATGRRIGLVLAVTAVVAVVAAAGVLIVASGGPAELAGSFSEAVSEPQASGAAKTSQERLLSLQSERFQEYAVSLGVFASSPLTGTGAGTWFVDWRMDRPIFYNELGDPYEVAAMDGHSWLLETLAELGLVGGLLLVMFVASFIFIAVRDLRTLGRQPQREVYGAFFAACIALLAHAMVDWDWEMPAVMLPFFMFAGGLLRYGRLSRTGEDKASASLPGGGSGIRRLFSPRILGIVACLLAMAVVLLPLMSETLRQSAQRLYDQVGSLESAQKSYEAIKKDARNASRWNPWNAEPLVVEAAAWQLEAEVWAAQNRSDRSMAALQSAEQLLYHAIELEPYSDRYYRNLALNYLGMNRPDRAAVAISKARELNPYESKETGRIEEMVREAGGQV